MADKYKNQVEALETGVIYCNKAIRLGFILLPYGLGYVAIYSLWAWVDSGRSVVDWVGIAAGLAVVIFEILLIRRTRRKRRAMIQAITNFKRADATPSYTAKEHYVDQAVAAMNIFKPGITAQIVKETIKELDDRDE